MHGPINVKSPNNTSKWQMGFNSAFKGLNMYKRIKKAVITMKFQFDNTEGFFCSTDQGLPNAPPDTLPAGRRTPHIGKV
jgi:hypothetical protein